MGSLWLLSTTALLPSPPLTPPRWPRPRLPSPRPTPPRRLLSPPLLRGRRGKLTLPSPTPLAHTPMLDLATPDTTPMLHMATLHTTPTATDLDPTTDEQ